MIDDGGVLVLEETERVSGNLSLRETTVQPAVQAKPYLEGPKVQVVLLTEGLGNIVDKNYYGPEAVRSMPQAFEGVSMFLDHPDKDEEKIIPERRVRSKVGYFKNLRVETVRGKLGCVGEVHFDLSEEGRNAFQKAKTAIHYREDEFPGQDREYVGISINAEASSYENREMTVEGKNLRVHYVFGFKVPADSADMVTMPARGGAFLALMESISGAGNRNKEASMKKTLERLEAAQAALKAAESEKDADARKQKVAEARQVVDSLLADVREAAKNIEAERGKGKQGEGEGEGKKGKQSESEDETESEKKKGKQAKKGKDGEDEDEDEGCEKKGKQSESDRPMARLAAQSLIRESGIAEKYFNLDKMEKMTVEDMKEYVADKKQMHEAALESIRSVIPAHLARESGLPAAEGEKTTLNSEFAAPRP